jgi:hypothetical protein
MAAKFKLTCDTGHESVQLGTFDTANEAKAELDRVWGEAFIETPNRIGARFYPMSMVKHFDIIEVEGGKN